MHARCVLKPQQTQVEEFKGIVSQNVQQVAQPDKPKQPFVPMGSPHDNVTMHQDQVCGVCVCVFLCGGGLN
jgi:hypothetical protein